MSVRVFAPAKINLTLEVDRPGADGRHALRSVAAFADVGDWIEASRADELSLEIEGPFAEDLADEPDNLALRAARLLAGKANIAPKARLRLEKHLPVASGMGGGSSDAAAALKALNALWGLAVAESTLVSLSASLGADVPVCVAARSAVMEGTGEISTPFETPTFEAVLVNPRVPLSTALVYRRFDELGLGAPPVGEMNPWRDASEAFAFMRGRGNDLEGPARTLAPELIEAAHLMSTGAGVRHVAMTGSGATMFALLEDRASAEALAGDIRAARPNWWVQPTRIGGS